MSWQDVFKKEQELILSTCSLKGEPNVNIVVSLGFYDNKLLVADVQMDITVKNLFENNKICVFSKYNNLYYKIKGTVEIFSFGKYFDICKNENEDSLVKHAILITINEVFDLDNVKKIF